jgi:hypothetical protein
LRPDTARTAWLRAGAARRSRFGALPLRDLARTSGVQFARAAIQVGSSLWVLRNPFALEVARAERGTSKGVAPITGTLEQLDCTLRVRDRASSAEIVGAQACAGFQIVPAAAEPVEVDRGTGVHEQTHCAVQILLLSGAPIPSS